MFCHKCGEKNEHNGKFCLNCGAELIQTSSSVQPAPAPAAVVPQEKTVQKKRGGKGLVIGITAAILVTAAVAAVTFLAPILRYNEAMDLMYAHQYEDAATAFEALDDYKNSESLAQEATYLYAEELMENGKYEEAYRAFKQLEDYKDSDTQMREAYYLYGLALLEQEEYEFAVDVFASLGDYKDSGEKTLYANYRYAQMLLENGKYGNAADIFNALGSYADSDCYLRYTVARSLEESDALTDAAALFEELGDFLDARERRSNLLAKINAENVDQPEDIVRPENVVSYDGSEVTITFYHTMGSKLLAVLDTYIAEFNKLYPNIHIEYTTVGNFDDVRNQIGTEIAVSRQPNIAYCYPDHVALYNLAGAVVSLDSLIASQATVYRADGTKEILGLTDAQKADFIDGFYNEGMQYGDGKMYTLPMSKSTEVLYYNKTFFEQHGLKVPETWEEMERVCAQIKAIDPNCIPLGYDSESSWFITMCEQYGSPYTSATGDHYLFNNAANRSFVKKFHEWYQEGYLTTQTLYGAYTSGLFTNLDGTRSYMCIGTSASATYCRPAKVNGAYPFEVGIATVPQVNSSDPKVISQGPNLCIFNKDNEQEVIASWLFVKFLTTNVEFQAEFAMASGYVPVLKSVSDNEFYANFIAKADGFDYIAALSAKVCMEQQDAYFALPAFNGSATARDQVGDLMVACMTYSGFDTDAVVKEKFRDALDECERMYDTNGLTGLSAAAAYLYHLYSVASETTCSDVLRVSTVTICGVTYEVRWSADDESIKIVNHDDRFVTIDVDEKNPEEVIYTLTATLKDAKGATQMVSFKHRVPAAIIIDMSNMSYEEIVDAAYRLDDGFSLEGVFRLRGTIIKIDTPWSDEYQNLTVTIQVGDLADKPIMCYRLKGEGAKDLAVGDIITVEGTFKNYRGTIEFDVGCVLVEVE